MSLDAVVRAGLKVADTVTAALQGSVTVERWAGNNEYNEPAYAPPVTVQALVEYGQKPVRTTTGETVLARATLTVPRALSFVSRASTSGGQFADGTYGSAPFGGWPPDRNEPIDYRDRITLPDGTIARVLNIEGVVDPSTGAPYALQIAVE